MTQQATAPDASSVDVARAATASDETPVFLAAGDEFVFGVATAPLGEPNGTAVLCLHAGPQNIASHRNGMYTRLCRSLAGQGYRTLRMDFYGSGDSSGLLAERSISGQTTVDVDAAVAWLLAQGAERVAILGTCFGGRVALAAASRHDAVTSVCLISSAVRGVEGPTNLQRTHHGKLSSSTAQMLRTKILKRFATDAAYRRWLLNRARERVWRTVRKTPAPPSWAPALDTNRAEAGFRETLEPLVRRHVPVHMLYGTEDHTYQASVRHGSLDMVQKFMGDLVDVEIKPNRVHGLVTLQAQDQIVDYVQRSLASDRARTSRA